MLPDSLAIQNLAFQVAINMAFNKILIVKAYEIKNSMQEEEIIFETHCKLG